MNEKDIASNPSSDNATPAVTKEKKLRSKGWSDADSLLLIKAWAHVEATKRRAHV